jgi:UDP-N-acetylglucosamine 2-epimerase (non-hydrolysing)
MLIIVLGTRPEIIKLFPIIKVFLEKKISFKVIHTGQHYSSKLSDTFIKQLKLPTDKIINLNVGSANHGSQTALMIIRIEKYIKKYKKIKGVIVYGDTNSALAGALVASKIPSIKLIHLEAGLRSFDKSMPEELNRRLIDHSSDLLLCPTLISKKYLLKEGIPSKKIFVTGNTVSDAIKSDLTQKNLNLKNNNLKNYIVLTIHREENTLNENNLKKILEIMCKIYKKTKYRIIFPTHPKTKKILNKISYDKKKIESVEPMDYFNFLNLIRNSKLIVSDSGGVQEEACLLKVPLITIRNSTERPETLEIGCNILSKIQDKMVYKHAMKILNRKIKWKNPYGNGNAALKSYRVIKNFLNKNNAKYY